MGLYSSVRNNDIWWGMDVVKEQPVPEYLTTSFGILGQLDKNF